MRVRVTGEFLTVHWEEIIREWVKPWVTPARDEGEDERGKRERSEESDVKVARPLPLARNTRERTRREWGKIILN